MRVSVSCWWVHFRVCREQQGWIPAERRGRSSSVRRCSYSSWAGPMSTWGSRCFSLSPSPISLSGGAGRPKADCGEPWPAASRSGAACRANMWERSRFRGSLPWRGQMRGGPDGSSGDRRAPGALPPSRLSHRGCSGTGLWRANPAAPLLGGLFGTHEVIPREVTPLFSLADPFGTFVGSLPERAEALLVTAGWIDGPLVATVAGLLPLLAFGGGNVGAKPLAGSCLHQTYRAEAVWQTEEFTLYRLGARHPPRSLPSSPTWGPRSSGRAMPGTRSATPSGPLPRSGGRSRWEPIRRASGRGSARRSYARADRGRRSSTPRRAGASRRDPLTRPPGSRSTATPSAETRMHGG